MVGRSVSRPTRLSSKDDLYNEVYDEVHADRNVREHDPVAEPAVGQEPHDPVERRSFVLDPTPVSANLPASSRGRASTRTRSFDAPFKEKIFSWKKKDSKVRNGCWSRPQFPRRQQRPGPVQTRPRFGQCADGGYWSRPSLLFAPDPRLPSLTRATRFVRSFARAGSVRRPAAWPPLPTSRPYPRCTPRWPCLASGRTILVGRSISAACFRSQTSRTSRPQTRRSRTSAATRAGTSRRQMRCLPTCSKTALPPTSSSPRENGPRVCRPASRMSARTASQCTSCRHRTLGASARTGPTSHRSWSPSATS